MVCASDGVGCSRRHEGCPVFPFRLESAAVLEEPSVGRQCLEDGRRASLVGGDDGKWPDGFVRRSADVTAREFFLDGREQRTIWVGRWWIVATRRNLSHDGLHPGVDCADDDDLRGAHAVAPKSDA